MSNKTPAFIPPSAVVTFGKGRAELRDDGGDMVLTLRDAKDTKRLEFRLSPRDGWTQWAQSETTNYGSMLITAKYHPSDIAPDRPEAKEFRPEELK